LREARAHGTGAGSGASARIFTYGVQVAVLFTNIHGIRSLAIIGMILPGPSTSCKSADI
jgi:hypothetical protein